MPQPPPKKEVAFALLERGSLFVHLDPRVEGVVVPRHFRAQPQLVLQFGMNLPVPIADLEVDEEGVFGTLSFSRSPFYCRIPWRSVFGMVGDDGMGVVWPDDLPPEVEAEVRAAEAKARRPALRAIEGGAGKAARREHGASEDALEDDDPFEDDPFGDDAFEEDDPFGVDDPFDDDEDRAFGDEPPDDEPPRPSGPPKLRLVK